MSDRYAPPREVLRVWRDEFDVAYREGTMFLLTTRRQAAEYVAERAGM